jgi:hypothetical protein
MIYVVYDTRYEVQVLVPVYQMKAVMVNLRCETKGTQERTNLKVIKYKVWKCNRLRSMKGRVIDRCQNKS